tara:strand:- start:24 stop:605 length:582 start_codon:yes stop_codon:yes gene_type:complete
MIYVNDQHVYKFKDYSECIFETQVQSKNWLGERLRGVCEHNKLEIKEIDVAASWYGIVLVPFLRYYLNDVNIKFNLYDVDWYTTEIARHIFDDEDTVTVHTNDVVFDDIEFKGDTFINCSCEHMFDMKELTQQNKDKLFVFQSNDNRNVQWMHINCVDTPEELARQAGIRRIYDQGIRNILRNNRIMVIGRVE